jgi:hypothetical protein
MPLMDVVQVPEVMKVPLHPVIKEPELGEEDVVMLPEPC